jgi:hypothetical protein
MKKEKTEDTSSGDKKVIVTAPLVLKSFVKKSGERTDLKEWYIQRSIQDYFIKFCESKVTRQELEAYLAEHGGPLKTAKLEVEFREGNWDICDDNELMQSRVGAYVVIYRIVQQ